MTKTVRTGDAEDTMAYVCIATQWPTVEQYYLSFLQGSIR